MLPIEVIAIMRSKGWLRSEPYGTREQITSAVRYMMVKTGMDNRRLAEELSDPELNHHVSGSYIRRKLSEHRWRMDDLDVLPEIFERDAADFVQGYRHMARLDDAEHATDSAEEEPHDE